MPGAKRKMNENHGPNILEELISLLLTHVLPLAPSLRTFALKWHDSWQSIMV